MSGQRSAQQHGNDRDGVGGGGASSAGCVSQIVFRGTNTNKQTKNNNTHNLTDPPTPGVVTLERKMGYPLESAEPVLLKSIPTASTI